MNYLINFLAMKKKNMIQKSKMKIVNHNFQKEILFFSNQNIVVQQTQLIKQIIFQIYRFMME
jgi:hypothetical protein